VAERLNAAVC